jgi:RNA polymerase sigma-70 factor (ECF subfamily)
MTARFADDTTLLAALRARDEDAFAWLVARYHGPLLRLAQQYVPSRAVAEDVVQDTFVAVIKGIDAFEGRSSLKTWIYRILLNIARTRGAREQRTVPFASVAASDPDDPIEADWFLTLAEDPGRHWRTSPQRWDGLPEERALAAETRAALEAAIDALPPSQREVVVLRDVLGYSSAEVCNALGITETNQRVLLHRARTRLRAALAEHYTRSTA